MLYFCMFQCFAEKEYQTESKRNENFRSVIFGTNVIQRTWSGRQATNEAATRQGGPPTPPGGPSTLVGPLWLYRPTCSSPMYPRTPKPSDIEPKTLFPPPQPSVPVRSHLGAFSVTPPEGASIMEGFYIITISRRPSGLRKTTMGTNSLEPRRT